MIPTYDPTTIRYAAATPLGIGARVFLTLVFLVVAGFLGAGAFGLLHSFELTCSRAERTCALTRHLPIVGATRWSYPLADVQRARVEESRDGKNRIQHTLIVDTSEGPLVVPTEADQMTRQAVDINEFLASKSSPSLRVVGLQPMPGLSAALAAGSALMLFLLAWLLAAQGKGATVRVDAASRRLTLERWRFLRRPWTRTFALDEIAEVVVRDLGWVRTKAGSYQSFVVALALRSGEQVPLEKGGGPVRQRHERAAQAIRDAIAAA